MKISILGSTGSIGRQTLSVCRDLGIEVCAVSAGSNIDLLEQQIREFKIPLASVYNNEYAYKLKKRLCDTNTKVVSGQQGNIEVATYSPAEKVVTAMTGMIGLLPTMAAIDAKKDIALANKETLVCAGHIIMKRAAQMGVKILPVDSEHSAIFQSLSGHTNSQIKKIILTASGGPFFGYTAKKLENVTVEAALNHPNWKMGAKITVDSATMMNKGLEIIEAMWLFDIPCDQIEVVIHRESILHSAVEFYDNSVIAQLGVPQMYLPIKYALTYPKRVESGNFALSFFNKTLTFHQPDEQVFSCLSLAKRAGKTGGLAPTVMNAANECAVELFLKQKLLFHEIPALIEKTMNDIVEMTNIYSIDTVIATDKKVREYITALF